MPNDDLSMSEQAAFSEAHELIKSLRDDPRLNPVDIGKGIMGAAVSCLMKELPNDKVAEIFYQVADDFACRSDDE